MPGSRADERVDRLVVVPDCAEVIALAEPALEQRLLEQVDVLVLVHGEGREARAEAFARGGVVVQEADRALEEILEVELAGRLLSPLVFPEYTLHQVDGNRRLVVVEPPAVGDGVRRRFLAHSTSVARSPAGRKRKAPGRAFPICRSSTAFEGSTSPGSTVSEGAKLRQRSRVERPGLDPIDAQRLEPRPHLPRRLVREGDGKDLPRLEGAACDLVRNSAGDRGRLSGARASEDAHRAPNRLDGSALLGVKPRADALGVHRLTLEPGSADARKRTVFFAKLER